MLQHIIGQDQVEGLVLERQRSARFDLEDLVDRLVLQDDRIDVNADHPSDVSLEIAQLPLQRRQVALGPRAAAGAEIENRALRAEQRAHPKEEVDETVVSGIATGGDLGVEPLC